jgi:hypothetical protein
MYIWAGPGGLTRQYDTDIITNTLYPTKLSEACKVKLTEKDATAECTNAVLTRKTDSFKWTIVRGTEKYVQFDIQDMLYKVEPSYCNFEFQLFGSILPATFKNDDSKRIIELDIFENPP